MTLDANGLLYPLSGLLVGFIVGITGVGGGSLMTPLLVLLFGVHPATAVGTDLLYAGVTKSVGTLAHNARATVDWTIVRRLATGSVPAAALTLLALAHLHADRAAVGRAITLTLGVALLLTAVSILFRAQIVAFLTRRFPSPSPRRAAQLTVLAGAALGVLVTMSSVGAGALGVVALVALYPQTPAVRIVGSDIAHAVPLTLLAGLGHWWFGGVDWALCGALLVGSVPGILLGTVVASRVSDRGLRPILACVLLIVGTQLVI